MVRAYTSVIPNVFAALLLLSRAGAVVELPPQVVSEPPKQKQPTRWAILECTSDALRRDLTHKLDELGKAYAQTLNDLHAGETDTRRPLIRKTSNARVFTPSLQRDSPSLKRDLQKRDSALLSEFNVRGDHGFCPSCEVDGIEFYKATENDNRYGEMLTNVRMLPSHRAVFPTQGIYSIDEYHLDGDSQPFRWAYPSHSMFLKSRPSSERKNFWNSRSVSLWSKLIQPGSNGIDIGAGIGDTSIQIAAHTAGGRVVAFESNPSTAMTAQAQSLLNHQLNIDVHPVSVGSTYGSAEVKVDCDDCGTDKKESAMIKVPQVQLSSFLHEHYGDEFLRNVTFVKIDTEGHDQILTKVLQPLLQTVRPKIWVRWFRPLSNLGYDQEVLLRDSRDLFETVKKIDYIPVHPETGSPLKIDSQGYLPDILLLPIHFTSEA